MPTKHTPASASPSTSSTASTTIVSTAGVAHANRWKYTECRSSASWPHFSALLRNHVNASTTHQTADATVKKYSSMKRIVQLSCFVPCTSTRSPLGARWQLTISSLAKPTRNANDTTM